MSKSIVKSMVKTHTFYLLYTFSGVDSIIFQIQPVTRLETSSHLMGFMFVKVGVETHQPSLLGVMLYLII